MPYKYSTRKRVKYFIEDIWYDFLDLLDAFFDTNVGQIILITIGFLSITGIIPGLIIGLVGV